MDFKTALAQILGKNIKELRQNLDMNQDDLAERIGLTRTSISNIEAGRQLAPLDLMYKLFHELGTELHFILPSYNDLSSQIQNSESTLDKLKTKNVSDSSIEAVKNIISKYK
ncbi:helix-turn-helix transcriptional regulator [Pedobacter sp. PWIIR3]